MGTPHAPEERPRRFAMFRSFGLADLVTFGNLAFGLAAIFGALDVVQTPSTSTFVRSTWLLFGAFVCDVLDGPLARRLETQSAMGRELDSFSDAVSFGVAPVALCYSAGYRAGWDRVVLTFFLICGIARLARFNVTSDALSFGGNKVRYTLGVPIPTTMFLMLAMGALAWFDRLPRWVAWGTISLGPWALHPTVLVFGLLGPLMVSTTIKLHKP